MFRRQTASSVNKPPTKSVLNLVLPIAHPSPAQESTHFVAGYHLLFPSNLPSITAGPFQNRISGAWPFVPQVKTPGCFLQLLTMYFLGSPQVFSNTPEHPCCGQPPPPSNFTSREYPGALTRHGRPPLAKPGGAPALLGLWRATWYPFSRLSPTCSHVASLWL